MSAISIYCDNGCRDMATTVACGLGLMLQLYRLPGSCFAAPPFLPLPPPFPRRFLPEPLPLPGLAGAAALLALAGRGGAGGGGGFGSRSLTGVLSW
jgi:hypothetical protein